MSQVEEDRRWGQSYKIVGHKGAVLQATYTRNCLSASFWNLPVNKEVSCLGFSVALVFYPLR
jgi:hypothetical protein